VPDLAFDWRFVTGALLLWAAFVSITVILERRSAAATLAWVLILLLLPIVGMLVYRLIGPTRLARRKLRRAAGRHVLREALGSLAAIEQTSHEHRQLAMIAIRAGEAPPLRARELELYTEGEPAYAALVAAIAAACHHVHLEYYIWEPDHIGARLRDALIERARAGVEVRLLLDATGSRQARGAFLRPLREAGARIGWFNPVGFVSLRRKRADFRTHRKIVVVDGDVGFTGGMNVTDVHTAEFTTPAWRDTHLRLTGSAVRALQRVWLEDWLFATGEQLAAARYLPEASHEDGRIVQIVSSGPDTTEFAIHKILFAVVNQANHRLWLTTPYFVPDDPLQAALVTAALRGLDVRLLLPRKGDSRLVDLAARSYFPELLAAGVRIYELTERFVHAKTIVVDDEVAIVGTANLDNRSFRLNFEVVAVLYDRAAACTLAEAFERDLATTSTCATADYDRQPLPRRLGQAVARLFSPLL
jgi:cardiolipin synthase